MAIYCDAVVPSYQVDCCANEPGRIIAVAYIRTDSIMNSTNYTAVGSWTQAITDGTVEIIKCVRGTKPASTEESIDGYGRQMTRTVSRNFTANYRHADVIDNVDFYDAMNFSTSYRVGFYTQGSTLWVVEDQVVNVDADYEIPEGLNSLIDWNVNVTWADDNLAAPTVGVPVSIFEET